MLIRRNEVSWSDWPIFDMSVLIRCTKDRCFRSVVSTNAARYQMAPICSKRRGLKANGTAQTRCNCPVVSPDPFWAYCAYGRQHRCQEDPVNSLSRGLEETSRTPQHHTAEHHTAGSEMPLSRTACSNGYGPELRGLCGWCGQCTALQNLELHDMNDDDVTLQLTKLQGSLRAASLSISHVFHMQSRNACA